MFMIFDRFLAAGHPIFWEKFNEISRESRYLPEDFGIFGGFSWKNFGIFGGFLPKDLRKSEKRAIIAPKTNILSYDIINNERFQKQPGNLV